MLLGKTETSFIVGIVFGF